MIQYTSKTFTRLVFRVYTNRICINIFFNLIGDDARWRMTTDIRENARGDAKCNSHRLSRTSIGGGGSSFRDVSSSTRVTSTLGRTVRDQPMSSEDGSSLRCRRWYAKFVDRSCEGEENRASNSSLDCKWVGDSAGYMVEFPNSYSRIKVTDAW